MTINNDAKKDHFRTQKIAFFIGSKKNSWRNLFFLSFHSSY